MCSPQQWGPEWKQRGHLHSHSEASMVCHRTENKLKESSQSSVGRSKAQATHQLTSMCFAKSLNWCHGSLYANYLWKTKYLAVSELFNLLNLASFWAVIVFHCFYHSHHFVLFHSFLPFALLSSFLHYDCHLWFSLRSWPIQSFS